MVDLEDRQAERTFRAWQVVLTVRTAGSSRREAVEYLNREFDGRWCGFWMNRVSKQLTGNNRRKCLNPRKARESLVGIEAAKTLAVVGGASARSSEQPGAGEPESASKRERTTGAASSAFGPLASTERWLGDGENLADRL